MHKNKIKANIGQEAIDKALEAVERRERGAADDEVAIDRASIAATAGELASVKIALEEALLREADAKSEQEKLMRLVADAENSRKRSSRESDEAKKFANERLVKDFLPIYDNLERALEHAPSPSDFASLKTGVEMIRKQLVDALAKHHVKIFSAAGDPFDPTVHEAMSTEATSDVPPQHVLREVAKGFTLNDRLVRPALVVVSEAKDTEGNDKQGDS